MCQQKDRISLAPEGLPVVLNASSRARSTPSHPSSQETMPSGGCGLEPVKVRIAMASLASFGFVGFVRANGSASRSETKTHRIVHPSVDLFRVDLFSCRIDDSENRGQIRFQ